VSRGRAREAAGTAAAWLGAALTALGLAGCGGLKALVSPPPPSTPSERAGWLVYQLDGLRLEAPAGWSASGDAGRVSLETDGARLEAWAVEARFADQAACLAAAEESLQRGAERLTRVRRHTTSLAGHAALLQEADTGGWHGWAYAACRGARQYRVVFTGRSPIPTALLETWRDVVKGVRLGGGP